MSSCGSLVIGDECVVCVPEVPPQNNPLILALL
jgi:hypothetical protein